VIDAKDMARKAASGCGHNQPIVVPCAGCIEASMRQWEEAVRHDTKQSMRDEMNRMKEAKEEAELKAAKTIDVNNQLSKHIGELNKSNIELRTRLRDALMQVDELNVQLAAELTMSHRPSMPMVHE
jgi:DNA repair exonuclease SbcCD ATPase subunit